MAGGGLNFWIIHAQENPAEPRGSKNRREWRSNSLAERLSDRGHVVFRWRSSFSHQAKRQLVDGSAVVESDGYSTQYIWSPPYRRHVGVRRAINHECLAREFLALASDKTSVPDLIHVGNVPTELASAAVRFGTARGIPTVVDIRDLWPDAFLDVLPFSVGRYRTTLEKLLHHASFRMRNSLRNATAITALTDSFLEWALKIAGRSRNTQDAVFPMCYPSPSTNPTSSQLASLHRRLGTTSSDTIVAYLGNLGYQSNFDTIVRASKHLSKEAPHVKFVLAGSGPRFDELRVVADEVSGLIVPGWLDSEEIAALLCSAKLGVIAYRNVPNYLRNIPNKFSEYLAAGLPIVCGIKGEMGDVVRTAGCGITYAEHNDAELAGKLAEFAADPEALQAASLAARRVHSLRFDRDQVLPAFISHLEAMADANG